MACLLIIDDDLDVARHLAMALRVALGGADEIVCLSGIGEYRLWRRQAQADLIIVELMRQQSNGFSLAAALVRQSRTTVALLSDRVQASDRHWAQARGVPHILSRQSGLAAMALQISVLLGRVSDLPEASAPEMAGLSGLDELCISPSDAMLACLYEDLRHWTPGHNSKHWIVTTRPTDSLNWLTNLLPFIKQSRLRNAITTLVAQNNVSACMTLCAREQVLFYLTPEPAAVLRNLLVRMADDVYACFQSSPSIRESSVLKTTPHAETCGHLLNAMAFLPGASALIPSASAELTVRDFILVVQCVLESCTTAKPRVEKLPANSIHIMDLLGALAVRPTLLEACLMLTTLGVQQHVQLLLDACLAQRYQLPGHDAVYNLAGDQVPVPWIAERLAAIHSTLTGDDAPYLRLSTAMVSVYKLRARLYACAGLSAVVTPGLRSWQILVACLCDCVCHLVLQSDDLSAIELQNLKAHVGDLQQCAAQGVVPPQQLSVSLAAAEISLARRAQSGDGHEHQTLSAGLHRLPEPDTIVSGLFDDISLSGSLLSEIRHELQLLTVVAQRLAVERVESLSRLMLDCHQRISMQPELLQDKAVRLALGKAHRVLCRLLDQAAAWRPLTEHGLQSSVSTAINTLFLLFSDQHSRHRGKTRASDHQWLERYAGQTADWARCRSLNGRLRHLLRRARNPEEYRSLMLELLREQHAIIATYLPYQPPD